jgi:hypothetical protein
LSLFSFLPLIMHDPSSNIFHSNFSILGTQLFFSRIELLCKIHNPLWHFWFMPKWWFLVFYFLHWSLLTIQWIFSACNS